MNACIQCLAPRLGRWLLLASVWLASAAHADIAGFTPAVFALNTGSGGSVTVTVQAIGPEGTGLRQTPAALCAELRTGAANLARANPCEPGSEFARVAVGVNTRPDTHSFTALFALDVLTSAALASAATGRPQGSRRFFLVVQYAGPLSAPQWIAVRIELIEPAPTGIASASAGLIDVSLDAPTPIQIRYTQISPDTPLAGQFCTRLVGAYPPRGVSETNPCALGSGLGFAGAAVGFDRSASTGERLVVPETIARQATRQARGGGDGIFYFARRFASGKYGVVRLRLIGDSANGALTLTDVRLAFRDGDQARGFGFFKRGQTLPAVSATLHFRGAGLLRARWEVVMPGDEPPRALDLSSEASLAPLERGQQRRYRLLERIQVMLPPVGQGVLRGPDPRLLPNDQYGRYLLLLRIEASDSLAGVPSGGAPFALPVLQYYVGESANTGAHPHSLAETIVLLSPPAGVAALRNVPLAFEWRELRRAALYRIELEASEQTLHAARIRADAQAGSSRYLLPPFVADSLPDRGLRWRVVALGEDGQLVGESHWQDLATQR